jgi:hypothetical protein
VLDAAVRDWVSGAPATWGCTQTCKLLHWIFLKLYR